jgi:NADH-quinone oxidoreductase subunit J
MTMGLTAGFFYLFASLAVLSGAMVIVAKNPVHAVLFLILTFFNAAGLFILLNAEFLAMLLVIVYVGAVAVLFLFVVMMLDVDFAELRAGFIKNAPLGALIGGILVAELIMVLGTQAFKPGVAAAVGGVPIKSGPGAVSNTAALGQVLYTKYIYFFQGAGLILLVAMIGAIVLTLRHKEGVRRQNIGQQNARGPKTAMDVVKVPSGGYTVPPKAPVPVKEAAE